MVNLLSNISKDSVIISNEPNTEGVHEDDRLGIYDVSNVIRESVNEERDESAFESEVMHQKIVLNTGTSDTCQDDQ